MDAADDRDNGRGGEPHPPAVDPAVLRKYFSLDDADLAATERCRGASNRLGFAVQLCWLRWRGGFLDDADLPTLPAAALATVAVQLGLLMVDGLLRDYPGDPKTGPEHRERIRGHLGFARCDETQRARLLDFLRGETLRLPPRAAVLRESAARWLRERKIVRPGRTTLRELVGTARDSALEALYERITATLDAGRRERIDALLAVAPEPPAEDGTAPARSALEGFKVMPRRESPAALLELTRRLSDLDALGLSGGAAAALAEVHPATRARLAAWGWRYDAWSLRRFAPAKRYAIVLAFLAAARAEATDALVEMQDKLITRVHHQAKRRRETLLRQSEDARGRAVTVLGELGAMIADESIADGDLRAHVLARWPGGQLAALAGDCRDLGRVAGVGDGSHLGLLTHWHGYCRQYAPALLESLPCEFGAGAGELGRAVAHLREVNARNGRRLGADAPTGFLAPRWRRHVVGEGEGGDALSRPHYEMAVLTTLNERIKSGDVTVAGSRRWTDFEDYLLPAERWRTERPEHYAALGLPMDAGAFIADLGERLAAVTAGVEARVPANAALIIDAERGGFTLARTTARDGEEQAAAAERLGALIEAELPRVDLVDVLIEADHATDFLRHFLPGQSPGGSRLPPEVARRNALAALLAVGCNLGAQRMAAATAGAVSAREIARVADWQFTEETLKAASIDLVNHAAALPLSRVWGRGNTCSADGMRFHVPVNVLSADYSPVLQARGVTLLAHTADNYLQLHQRPVPCRLREATFVLDGLLEHDTEMDPRTCFTDSHGFTEVVLAAAALLGFELAPRIRDLKDQTLYRMAAAGSYPRLDPLLRGVIRPPLIFGAWDEAVRVIASLRARTVSASLILHRLGSYARQNSVHQALAEIGRVHKTMFLLRYLDDAELRRRVGRELNKGEASHDLSRFLCFGKEGTLRGREFEDQLHSFSALAVLHNAVVAWNTVQIGHAVARLRARGVIVGDQELAATSPLLRRHINPFGHYHFNLERMRRPPPAAGA